MNENYKTIKELADELGVSKQTIRNKIDKDFREKFVQTIKIKGNNTLVINNTGYSLLKKTLRNDTAQTAKTLQNDTAQTKLICFLEEQLDKKEQQLSVKDKQLENKDTQISQMQNLLDQQQRLALQDKKLLEEYKAENDSLKALNVPSEHTKGGQVNSQPKEEVQALKNQMEGLQEQLKEKDQELAQEKSKKWYQFWK